MIPLLPVSGHGVYFLLLCMTPLVFSDRDEVRSSCAIAVKENSGRLTCQFSKDIGQARYNFVVHRYDLDVTDTSPDIVLDCHWLDRDKEKELFCITPLEEYVFDGKVSNKAEIEMPFISGKQRGRYLCQILTGISVTFEDQCNYTGGSRLDGSTTVASTNASPLSTSPEDKSTEAAKGKDDENISRTIGITTVTSLLIVLVLLFLYAVVCRCYQNRGTCKGGTRSNDRHVEDELTPMRTGAGTSDHEALPNGKV